MTLRSSTHYPTVLLQMGNTKRVQRPHVSSMSVGVSDDNHDGALLGNMTDWLKWHGIRRLTTHSNCPTVNSSSLMQFTRLEEETWIVQMATGKADFGLLGRHC